MLKTRILTAAILLPLFVLALWYLPPPGMGLLLGIFILLATWEWAGLSGLARLDLRLLYLLVIAVAAIAMLYTPLAPLLLVVVAWWCWAGAEIVYDKDLSRSVFVHRVGRWFAGVLVLAPAWLAAVYLFGADPRRPAVLLFLFIFVWAADTAAYFIGRAFGKRKLAPHVSPGKTVAGAVGGVATVALVALISGNIYWELSGRLLLAWTLLGVVTAVFSIVGDLMESKLKRIAGAKDSGRLLPGHGGVLDRIDAFTAAAPVYALGVSLIGRPVL